MLQIPIPESKQKDIFDYGFDRRLYRSGVEQSRVAYDIFDGLTESQSLHLSNSIFTSRGATTFGGSGSDGRSLTITSGTTTIDLGSAAFVTKNYSSISITGTGVLAFSNPHANGTVITLRSLNGFTVTSTATRAIDLRSLGATGGAPAGSTTQGTVGTDPNKVIPSLIMQGVGGKFSNTSTSVGDTVTNTVLTWPNITINGRIVPLTCGAGGASGATGTGGASGAGGRGGGAMLIECVGDWNVTGTIDLGGAAGSNAAAAGGVNVSGSGGGGGGAGGTFFGIYTGTLVADTGTYTISGGAGGNGASDSGTGDTRACGGGGGGNSFFNAGGTGGGVVTRTGTAGQAGGGATGGAGGSGGATTGGGGGGGAEGLKLVVTNTVFA